MNATAKKAKTTAVKIIEFPEEEFSLASRLLFHLKEDKTKREQEDEEKLFIKILDRSKLRREEAQTTLSDLAHAVFFALNEMEDEALLYLVHHCRQSMEKGKDHGIISQSDWRCGEYISRGIEPIISKILLERSRDKEDSK